MTETLQPSFLNKGSEANDTNVLNTELGVEYEGIAAYQVAGESGLLQNPWLRRALPSPNSSGTSLAASSPTALHACAARRTATRCWSPCPVKVEDSALLAPRAACRQPRLTLWTACSPRFPCAGGSSRCSSCSKRCANGAGAVCAYALISPYAAGWHTPAAL
jgi:hypothetical protein